MKITVGTRVMYDEWHLESQWLQDLWFYRGTVVAIDEAALCRSLTVRWDHDGHESKVSPVVVEVENWPKRLMRAKRDWPLYVERSPDLVRA